jgi:hypothetical protein
MAYRRNARQVEIFNFSFLDILACTIGLLIFILVMIFLLQSASRLTDYKKIIQTKMKALREVQAEAKSTAHIANSIEAELSKMRDRRDPKLLLLLQAAREEMRRARQDANVRTAELSSLETGIESQQAVYTQQTQVTLDSLHGKLAAAMRQLAKLQEEQSAAKKSNAYSGVFFQPVNSSRAKHFNILHVLCSSRGLQILDVHKNGGVSVALLTPTSEIGDADSAYRLAVAAISERHNPLVIFWIYAGGIDAFNQARGEIPAGVHYGYEPALHRWKFMVDARTGK